jgi:hypothetical protein
LPASHVNHLLEKEEGMRRCIGLDIHREFAEVAVWEDGTVRPRQLTLSSVQRLPRRYQRLPRR